MLTIGDFSRATRITVKALRLYHDEGIIVPDRIDPVTGYRLYGETAWARAREVCLLRDLGFSHRELREILDECADDGDLAGHLSRRLASLDREIASLRGARDRIRVFLETGRGKDERVGGADDARARGVREIELADAIVCSIRFRGAYADVGERFQTLYRKAARVICGCPFSLYHDSDFREGDADIEAAVPVRRVIEADGVECRTLPGGRALSILHYGPYDRIGEAYRVVLGEAESRDLKTLSPTRESYRKGPGMIFPRDPKKFVTEIVIPFERA